MSRFLWVLDAGHGGIINNKYVTKGKRSPIWDDGTQYFEGVGNRNICKKLGKLLLYNNIEFINICDGIEQDITLKERCEIANKIYKKNKNMIFVSIHSDAFHDERANGYSVYTSKGETKSDKIAEVFINNMKTNFKKHKLRKDITDGDADKEQNFYVLKNTKSPAILIENFFMTNYRECKLLMNEKFINKLVNTHYLSIQEIENNEKAFF